MCVCVCLYILSVDDGNILSSCHKRCDIYIYIICGSLDVGIFKNFFLVTYIIIILLWLPAAQVHYAVCVCC